MAWTNPDSDFPELQSTLRTIQAKDVEKRLKDMFQGAVDAEVITLVAEDCGYDLHRSADAIMTILDDVHQFPEGVITREASKIRVPELPIKPESKSPSLRPINVPEFPIKGPEKATGARTKEMNKEEFPNTAQQRLFPSASSLACYAAPSSSELNSDSTPAMGGIKISYRNEENQEESDSDADVVIVEEKEYDMAAGSSVFCTAYPFTPKFVTPVLPLPEISRGKTPPKVKTSPDPSVSAAMSKLKSLKVLTSEPNKTSFPNPSLLSTQMLQQKPVKPLTEAEQVMKYIHEGTRIMVLMRGAPGSGKTHLARQIIVKTMGKHADFSKYIFSTDDFFVLLGRFIQEMLLQGHDWNKERVRVTAEKKISPIIVDNTNTQIWEMQPYAELAVKHGYFLHLLEPSTPWRYKEEELFRKNVHGVPRQGIHKMLARFERNLTGKKLLAILRLKYLPQNKPPQPAANSIPQPKLSRREKKMQNQTADENPKIAKPKTVRQRRRKKKKPIVQPDKQSSEANKPKQGLRLPHLDESQLDALARNILQDNKHLDPTVLKKFLNSGAFRSNKINILTGEDSQQSHSLHTPLNTWVNNLETSEGMAFTTSESADSNSQIEALSDDQNGDEEEEEDTDGSDVSVENKESSSSEDDHECLLNDDDVVYESDHSENVVMGDSKCSLKSTPQCWEYALVTGDSENIYQVDHSQDSKSESQDRKSENLVTGDSKISLESTPQCWEYVLVTGDSENIYQVDHSQDSKSNVHLTGRTVSSTHLLETNPLVNVTNTTENSSSPYSKESKSFQQLIFGDEGSLTQAETVHIISQNASLIPQTEQLMTVKDISNINPEKNNTEEEFRLPTNNEESANGMAESKTSVIDILHAKSVPIKTLSFDKTASSKAKTQHSTADTVDSLSQVEDIETKNIVQTIIPPKEANINSSVLINPDIDRCGEQLKVPEHVLELHEKSDIPLQLIDPMTGMPDKLLQVESKSSNETPNVTSEYENDTFLVKKEDTQHNAEFAQTGNEKSLSYTLGEYFKPVKPITKIEIASASVSSGTKTEGREDNAVALLSEQTEISSERQSSSTSDNIDALLKSMPEDLSESKLNIEKEKSCLPHKVKEGSITQQQQLFTEETSLELSDLQFMLNYIHGDTRKMCSIDGASESLKNFEANLTQTIASSEGLLSNSDDAETADKDETTSNGKTTRKPQESERCISNIIKNDKNNTNFIPKECCAFEFLDLNDSSCVHADNSILSSPEENGRKTRTPSESFLSSKLTPVASALLLNSSPENSSVKEASEDEIKTSDFSTRADSQMNAAMRSVLPLLVGSDERSGSSSELQSASEQTMTQTEISGLSSKIQHSSEVITTQTKRLESSSENQHTFEITKAQTEKSSDIQYTSELTTAEVKRSEASSDIHHTSEVLSPVVIAYSFSVQEKNVSESCKDSSESQEKFLTNLDMPQGGTGLLDPVLQNPTDDEDFHSAVSSENLEEARSEEIDKPDLITSIAEIPRCDLLSWVQTCSSENIVDDWAERRKTDMVHEDALAPRPAREQRFPRKGVRPCRQGLEKNNEDEMLPPEIQAWDTVPDPIETWESSDRKKSEQPEVPQQEGPRPQRSLFASEATEKSSCGMLPLENIVDCSSEYIQETKSASEETRTLVNSSPEPLTSENTVRASSEDTVSASSENTVHTSSENIQHEILLASEDLKNLSSDVLIMEKTTDVSVENAQQVIPLGETGNTQNMSTEILTTGIIVHDASAENSQQDLFENPAAENHISSQNKMDSSTITDYRDFTFVSQLNSSSTIGESVGDIKVVNAYSRSINADFVLVKAAQQTLPYKLMLDKGSMTTDEDDTATARTLSVNEVEEQLLAMFPQVPLSYLRELVEKCNFDLHWILDLLLESKLEQCESIMELPATQDTVEGTKEGEVESIDYANCEEPQTVQENHEAAKKLHQEEIERYQAVQENHETAKKLHQEEIKRYLEESVVLSDAHYSEHVLRVKKLRHGELVEDTMPSQDIKEQDMETGSHSLEEPHNIESLSANINNGAGGEESLSCSSAEGAVGGELACGEANIRAEIAGEDTEESESSNDDDEMIPITMDHVFISQFTEKFGNPVASDSENMQRVVSIPVSLARQIHCCIIQSQLAFMEQQQQEMEKMVQEDEELARRLQEQEHKQKPDNAASSLPNLQEIMDMEYALAVYKQDQLQAQGKSTKDDLATKLKKQKLIEMFPNFDREALMDVFSSSGNSLDHTVEVVKASVGDIANYDVQRPFERLQEEVHIETSRAKRSDAEVHQRTIPLIVVKDAEEFINGIKSSEEAMRAAEHYRSEARRHDQLRTELRNKANQSSRTGHAGVALFYCNLAQLHTKCIEDANMKACMMFLQAHTLAQNPTTLDFHYLYVREALIVLDLFLDHHISRLTLSQPKLTLYFITGWGKRSPDGKSHLKPAVVKRLNERNIKWDVHNRGMIRAVITRNTALSSTVMSQ